MEKNYVIRKLNRILDAQVTGEYDSEEAYRQTLILRDKLKEQRERE